MLFKNDAAHLEDFELGEPVLVCRWRLQHGALPLEGRHLRAFAARTVNGRPVSPQLAAWAKQHIEWTLRDGSAAHPNGVLMLVVDAQGRAAMSVGPYEPLADRSLAALAARAQAADAEAQVTGVAPESLWLVEDGVARSTSAPGSPAGAASLIADLAAARGLTVEPLPLADLEASAAPGGALAQTADLFLVSDEHGVQPVEGACGPHAAQFAADYAKLLAARPR